MADSEELARLIDAVYKSILEKFEPGARQLITAGKAYLKSLQGASAAAKVYMESLGRLARQAQQATWGDAADVGGALSQIVDVYREIQAQQLSLLKAFYVDLLVPLETNLEKDTKVMQAEQRRFQQTLKGRQEAYHKASAAVRKMQKKCRSARASSGNIDKELKNMQTLEEEKCNLDGFCEQSLRSVLTQERRRYGFVLERQCSLSKHYLAYHDKGQALIQHHLEDWQDIAQTREFLPESVEATLPCLVPIEGSLFNLDGIELEGGNADLYDLHARCTLFTPPRKTRSMDAACLDMRSMDEIPSRMALLSGRRKVQTDNSGGKTTQKDRHREGEPRLRLGPSPVPPLTRAKSEYNLSSSRQSLDPDSSARPRSMAVSDDAPQRPMVRALYSYLSSGDFQLSFHEGDLIAIAGDRNKGWQYGENLRSRRCGWFPVAYTELLTEEDDELTPFSTPRRSRRRRVSSTTLASAALSPTFDPFSLHRPNLFSRTASCPPSSSASGSKGPSSSSSLGSVPASPSPATVCMASQSGTLGSNLIQTSADIEPCSPSTTNVSEDDVLAAIPTCPPLESLGLTDVRRMRRSLTSPAPLLPPPHQATHVTLHRSNDSGLGAESNPHPPAGAGETLDENFKRQEGDSLEPRNMFAAVKLRKTFTNDRSAPRIS